MTKRSHTLRSLIFATTLALTTILATVATALADGGGGPFLEERNNLAPGTQARPQAPGRYRTPISSSFLAYPRRWHRSAFYRRPRLMRISVIRATHPLLRGGDGSDHVSAFCRTRPTQCKPDRQTRPHEP